MTLGTDIAGILADVGVPFSIIRGGVSVGSEFFDYDSNRLITKPFFIEHQLDVTFAYNTAVVPGDLLLSSDGRRFYCVHMWPEIFEGDITSFGAVLFKLNAAVDILSHAGTGKGPNSAYTWTPQHTDVPACLVWQNQGPHADTSTDPSQDIARRSYSCYIPKSLAVARDYRVAVKNYSRGVGPGGALNLSVVAFDDWTYTGTTVLVLAEDARG